MGCLLTFLAFVASILVGAAAYIVFDRLTRTDKD